VIILNYSIKDAFDSIKAETELKDNTYEYLKKEISIRSQKTKKLYFNKIKYAFITCLIILIFSIKGYNMYFKQMSLVSIDINPSIELYLNSFDKVIAYKVYNREKEILNNVSIKNKNYNKAIELLMETLDYYIKNDSYISFTVQSNSSNKEEILLNKIEICADSYLYSHHHNSDIEIEYSQIDSDLIEEAHSYGISAGKYKAILELQQIYPNVTVEECRHKSIKELKSAYLDNCDNSKNNHTNRHHNRNSMHHNN